MAFVSNRDKVRERNGYFAELESAKKVAKALALKGCINKIEINENLYNVHTECSSITWDEILENFNIKNDSRTGIYYASDHWLATTTRYNLVVLNEEAYKYDYDYDNYYDDYDYGHCSILEGGFDEPTVDEWERSGLL